MDENTNERKSLAQARRVVQNIEVVYADAACRRETRADAAAVVPWSPAESRATASDAEALFAIFTVPDRPEFGRRPFAQRRAVEKVAARIRATRRGASRRTE